MKKVIFCLLLVCSLAGYSQNAAINIEKSGKGTPVIFLPGFITPGSMWKETATNLKGKFESHFVSYAGFNGLAPIEMPWYSTIKNELFDYIRKNNLRKIILIGHSMGGNLAVELAAALGDVVEKVIIVDALACMREVMMPNVPAEALQYESSYNKQMLAMPDDGFANMANMMAQGMTTVKEKQELIKSWILTADRKTYVFGYTDLLKLDLRPTLAQIETPVLIVGAPFPSKEVVLANYEKQYANLNNKKLEIAPEGKHYIMYDQPDWLYNQINTFLGQ